MTSQGVSERRALALVRMSASSLRYTPAPDTNAALRARIVALAHQHRRYGAGMIYLKLRQAGALVNHKRVERLYTEARLQVRRRRRKKIPVADRQPLIRPQAPNEVWSADFVFDRTADGRVVKCLRRCCTNRDWPARCPPTGFSPADAIRHWSAEGDHPIEDLTAEDGLTLLPGWAPGAKAISDDGFVAEERILHPALTMVPCASRIPNSLAESKIEATLRGA